MISTELRIGNLVYYKCGIIIVTMIGQFGIQSKTVKSIINAKFSTPDIEPIPITEDILKDLRIGRTIYNKDSGYSQYGIYKNGFDFCFCIECNESPKLYINNALTKIDQLHQFQNAFSILTGEELPTDKILNTD